MNIKIKYVHPDKEFNGTLMFIEFAEGKSKLFQGSGDHKRTKRFYEKGCSFIDEKGNDVTKKVMEHWENEENKAIEVKAKEDPVPVQIFFTLFEGKLIIKDERGKDITNFVKKLLALKEIKSENKIENKSVSKKS